MSLNGIMTMYRVSRCSYFTSFTNGFHTSCVTYLNQTWREKKGWSKNPNKSGPLVTLPDYSFKDNRPVPYSSNLLKRIQKHQEYAKRVMKLIGEVDGAVERHDKLLKEREERKQDILANKLKPKGQKLVTSE